MARARNIKPGFFTNDDLVELPFEARLLFIGLWTIADRAGRLLDRPKKIKMDIFPGDNVECDDLLDMLMARGFIRRYEYDGGRAIQVVNWEKHQNPHVKEAMSTIPAPCERAEDMVKEPCLTDTSTMQAPDSHGANTMLDPEIPERAGLIPDSGFLIADSGLLIPDALPIASAVAPAEEKRAKRRVRDREEPNPMNLETWKAYKQGYAGRYGVAPIQNAKTNSLIKQIVQSLGIEAPAVAEFYVRHNGRNYVASMHQLHLLLADHAKLRTEWATDVRMTNTKANQVDRTETNASVFSAMIAEAEAHERAGKEQHDATH